MSYRAILILLIILAGLLLLVVVLQIRLYRKLKARNRVVISQSRKIKNQNQELENQNKELLVLDHEKQQIVSVVSHDLKGPFNRIFALIQLMSTSTDTGNLTEEQKDYLGKIHQIVADGLSMIRNLLDNRRLEDEGIEFTPKLVNVSTFLSSLLKNYRTLAEKKKIQIHFENTEGVIMEIDKSYLMRIVENLLSNALKFSAPNTSILVKLVDQKDSIELLVEDEGPGIGIDEQKKLFQKYQRLTPRPTGGESSTGLGLFIVKTIVEKMDGMVRCESEIGSGSKFIVRLKKKSVEQV